MYEEIKMLCKNERIGVTKLEETLGFARGSISKWEKNKPSLERVAKVADYFGVLIDTLIKRASEDNSKSESYEAFEQLPTNKKIKAIDVARATGINPSTLSDWKRGKSTPKVEKLQEIARYFGTSVETFIGGDASTMPIKEYRQLYKDLLDILIESDEMITMAQKRIRICAEIIQDLTTNEI